MTRFAWTTHAKPQKAARGAAARRAAIEDDAGYRRAVMFLKGRLAPESITGRAPRIGGLERGLAGVRMAERMLSRTGREAALAAEHGALLARLRHAPDDLIRAGLQDALAANEAARDDDRAERMVWRAAHALAMADLLNAVARAAEQRIEAAARVVGRMLVEEAVGERLPRGLPARILEVLDYATAADGLASRSGKAIAQAI